jgi:hypothetical protein
MFGTPNIMWLRQVSLSQNATLSEPLPILLAWVRRLVWVYRLGMHVPSESASDCQTATDCQVDFWVLGAVPSPKEVSISRSFFTWSIIADQIRRALGAMIQRPADGGVGKSGLWWASCVPHGDQVCKYGQVEWSVVDFMLKGGVHVGRIDAAYATWFHRCERDKEHPVHMSRDEPVLRRFPRV